jgi:hypothetical protein
MKSAKIWTRCSALQYYTEEKGRNPELYDALRKLNPHIEVLFMNNIGLNWMYESIYLEYISENFQYLTMLDLSHNSLGGPGFETWLVDILTKYSNLKINLIENPYCTWSTPFASKWRERVDGKLQSRIITHL